MTRVHAYVLIVFLLTVVLHVVLVGLVSLHSRRAGSRKDPPPSPLGVAPGELITNDRRRVGIDRPVRDNRLHEGRRGIAVYATCAGCGMPIALAHSTRRGLRRGITPARSISATPVHTLTE
jgi:hypothetical protein